MTEIKVLDKSIFNRIAAGEVVERPSSIVKELVENSIDAGATSISISIKNGGIDFIRVADNGKGIASTDIKTAFLPHATSKINKIEDLDGIATLGFRGEALPSIASVSRTTMVSRRAGDELGSRYCIDNGVEIDFGEIGAPFGTSVTVENLFDRIPARKKFLNKPSSEENAITSMVERFILANYNISFLYTVNDRTVYSSSGESMEDAIKTVYKSEYLGNMIKINSTMSDISLSGYINKPSFSKHSRAFQTLIVNGRYVINDDVSYTIFGCYQKYLMTRQYPTYVLYLTIPHDLVDVNVHPNKLQVKFAIPGLIKKIVADTIKSHIEEETAISKVIEDNFDDIFSPKHATESNKLEENGFTIYTPILDSTKETDLSQEKQTSNYAPSKVDSSILDFEVPRVVSFNSSQTNQSSKFKEQTNTIAPFTAKQVAFDVKPVIKIIGKIFNTYIIVEHDNDVYLIDQHAAHEKLIYDRYLKEFESGNVAIQNMLIPYKFNLSPEEKDVLLANMDALKEAGFTITSNSDDSFSLKTVPLCCAKLNVRLFINDFLRDDVEPGKNLLPQTFKEKLMQHACKSATKGEDDLSDIEINSLIEQMSAETSELFCPHGRPISIRLTRNEIEKWFKRIV